MLKKIALFCFIGLASLCNTAYSQNPQQMQAAIGMSMSQTAKINADISLDAMIANIDAKIARREALPSSEEISEVNRDEFITMCTEVDSDLLASMNLYIKLRDTDYEFAESEFGWGVTYFEDMMYGLAIDKFISCNNTSVAIKSSADFSINFVLNASVNTKLTALENME